MRLHSAEGSSRASSTKQKRVRSITHRDVKKRSKLQPTVQLGCAAEISLTIWVIARTVMKLRFPNDYVRLLYLMSLFIRVQLKNGPFGIAPSRHTGLTTYVSLGHELYGTIFGNIWSAAGISGSIIWLHHWTRCIKRQKHKVTLSKPFIFFRAWCLPSDWLPCKCTQARRTVNIYQSTGTRLALISNFYFCLRTCSH